MVEHWPVLPANVHNDLTKFVPDEERQGFVVSQKKFGQAAADLHFILRWNPKPHLVDQVLKERKRHPGSHLLRSQCRANHEVHLFIYFLDLCHLSTWIKHSRKFINQLNLPKIFTGSMSRKF